MYAHWNRISIYNKIHVVHLTWEYKKYSAIVINYDFECRMSGIKKQERMRKPGKVLNDSGATIEWILIFKRDCIFGERESKIGRSYKGRALFSVSEIFIWIRLWLLHMLHILYIYIYIHIYIYIYIYMIYASTRTCAPETQIRVCVYRERVRRRGCTSIAIREYYCGTGRSTTGEWQIYQRVGVYVATNCRVNIHAIPTFSSLRSPSPFHILVSNMRRKILDFNLRSLSSLLPLKSVAAPRHNNYLAHFSFYAKFMYVMLVKIVITDLTFIFLIYKITNNWLN